MIELLIVIAIILVIAVATLPTTIDFMKKSRLKGAASMIQMACLQARSQAIAQRERHFVILYTDENAIPAADFNVAGLTENQQGRANTLEIFDSNENSELSFQNRAQAEEFPEAVSVQSMGGETAFPSLVLEFQPTGRVRIIQGLNRDFPEGGSEVFAGNQADIVLQQDNGDHIAVVDIVRNTGQVHFDIRTP